MNSLPPDIFARHKRRKDEVNSRAWYFFKNISEFVKLILRIFLLAAKKKSSLFLHQTTEFVAESTRDSLQTRE